MKPFLVLVFNTSVGRDLTIRVSDADESLSDLTVATAMLDIGNANAISGVESIAGRKTASIFTPVRKVFDIS